jgi:hypothetical protein
MSTAPTASLGGFHTSIVRIKRDDGTLFEFFSAYSLENEGLCALQNSFLNIVNRAIHQGDVTKEEAILILIMTTNVHGDWKLATYEFMDNPGSLGSTRTYMDFNPSEASQYGFESAQVKATMKTLVRLGLSPAPDLD